LQEREGRSLKESIACEIVKSDEKAGPLSHKKKATMHHAGVDAFRRGAMKKKHSKPTGPIAREDPVGEGKEIDGKKGHVNAN